MAHILVIDDAYDVRTTIRKILEQEGHTITEASNGAEGIAYFKQQHIDLVVTDIVMPYKDGIEVIIEICKIDPGVKIIALSQAQEYLHFALDFGASKAFLMPFDAEKLKAEVKSMLASY